MCHTYRVQHNGKGHPGIFSISQCLCSRDPTTFSALPVVIQEFQLVILGSGLQEILPQAQHSEFGCSGVRRARCGVVSCPLCATLTEQKGGRKVVLAT